MCARLWGFRQDIVDGFSLVLPELAYVFVSIPFGSSVGKVVGTSQPLTTSCNPCHRLAAVQNALKKNPKL